jgi:uncharacterized protein (TIGR00255 family)
LVHSMTGYGRGEESKDGCHFIVEIRALNHRYLDLVVRLPRNLWALEEIIKRLLKEHLSRGRIEVYITLEMAEEKSKTVLIDEQLALAYQQAHQKLQKVLGLDENGLSAREVASFPEVLNLGKSEPDLDLLTPVLEKAATEAILSLVHQRKQEGSRLAEDIGQRLQRLGDIKKAIQEKGPLVLEEYRSKLQARLEALYQGQELDRQRLFLEVALYAEKCNIDEEIVRFDSHLQAIAAELRKEEAVGRKLDFLMQEINREVNTIASKSCNFEIASFTIAAKSEIEKIREQVQNIE